MIASKFKVINQSFERAALLRLEEKAVVTALELQLKQQKLDISRHKHDAEEMLSFLLSN